MIEYIESRPGPWRYVTRVEDMFFARYAGFFDYGPLGAELKNNLKSAFKSSV